MKKAFKIIGIVVGVLLLLMILLPIAFKGKIKEIIVKEGNEMIDGRFDFSRLGLSLFRNFPAVSASLHDFYLVGAGEFEGDTLARAGRLSIVFDLCSLFGDDGYDVRRIEISNALLNAIVLENGKANWDIMKSDDEAGQEEESGESSFRIKLRDLTVNNLALSYDDRQGKMYAALTDLDARLSGDLTASRSTLNIKADAGGLLFRMGGVTYLKNAELYAKMDVDADLDNDVYTLKDNVLRLNAIEAVFDGWIGLKDEGQEMDLKFSTPRISFKDILSLVPAIYAKDFEGLQATGDVSLSGWAKGMMAGDNLPAFDVDIKVDNATFRYPSLPQGVDAINIAASVGNPGGTADATVIDVNPFNFTMAGNPFSVKAHVVTPVSDAAFDASAHGTIDLGKIKEVYPLDSMELNGLVKADVSVSGRMSYVENEQYENIKAQGSVILTDMLLRTAGNPDVDIRKSTLTFSPRYLDLSETSLLIGRNDLTLDSRVENYIGWALQDKTLKGTMNLRSTYLNANDFMGGDTGEEVADTASMSVIEVPANLDLTVNAALDKVIYDNLEIGNLRGQIVVRDERAALNNLSMNTLGGTVKLTGAYSTAQSKDQPEFNADFNMDGLSFGQTFKSFVTIQRLAPLFENLQGSYSGNLTLSTLLDSAMTPVLPSTNGKGILTARDLSLSEVGVIKKIGELANITNITNSKVKDIKVEFTIVNGDIHTRPFDIRLGETVINLSGTTSLDQTIAYAGRIQLPAALAKTAMMSSVVVNIGGTFTSPKVSLDMKDMASQVISSVVADALGEVGDKLGIDLSDAQKQKEELVRAATEGGELIMNEARKQADALTAKAGKDPISQLAAKKAAATIITQAQLRVDDMVAKATAKGDSIISKAQAQTQTGEQ